MPSQSWGNCIWKFQSLGRQHQPWCPIGCRKGLELEVAVASRPSRSRSRWRRLLRRRGRDLSSCRSRPVSRWLITYPSTQTVLVVSLPAKATLLRINSMTRAAPRATTKASLRFTRNIVASSSKVPRDCSPTHPGIHQEILSGSVRKIPVRQRPPRLPVEHQHPTRKNSHFTLGVTAHAIVRDRTGHD